MKTHSIGFLVALSVVSGCGETTESAARDATASAPSEPARRVVSLSRSGSQLIIALGAESQVVGVDRASQELVPFQEQPIVDLETATSLSPDLILVDRDLDAGQVPGSEPLVMNASATNLDEGFRRIREVGSRLVGEAHAGWLVREIGGALATIGGASRGETRPKVVAVVGVEPLTFAGPHSFSTDLIEIAGGESLAHTLDHDLSGLELEELGHVDLVWVVTDSELNEQERSRFRREVPIESAIHFQSIDPDTIWIDGAVEAANRLRSVIVTFNESRTADRDSSR